ncbi:hypothetical protein MPSEU_000353200 [Mayamaea pseudoterrestris]|nr:hypothetical protein MPSEU_000353200 [Mayamaea pseudoterrestris]
MVGFGKSLRMARRSGWEGGYLDYETLKLLLSQIEAVYEEEAHRASNNQYDFVDAQSSRRRRNRIVAGRDYRNDLFLESDSEAAFASLNEDDNEQSNNINSQNDMFLAEEAVPKSFTLSYSHEATSSEEEEDLRVNGCGGSHVVPSIFAKRPWSSQGTADNTTKIAGSEQASANPNKTSSQETRNINNRRHSTRDEEEDNFAFVHHEQQTSFLLASDPDAATAITPRSSGYSQQPQHFATTEKSSLLPPATPVPHGSSLYTLSESLTPPASSFRHNNNHRQRHASVSSSAPAVPSLNGRASSINARKAAKKLEHERAKARMRRRDYKRKLRKLRESRERKVPTYLRVAHGKARAITERFLGLLRAETEKVLLFAQSRLGELADTAGSLRFPSFDDDHFHGQQKVEIRGTQYDYTLSDGGMHPSASSSSDDEQQQGGIGLTGVFPWSDSDDDRDNEHRVTLSAISRSDETAAHSLMSSVRTPRFGGSKKTTATTATNMVRRKISHFADIRNNRPVFQRNDHILGEDMLFLSAVEEADGYTAVAAELLHVLRFICVNLIAVRKICRKHDRLLMNRMLGGYYHRTQWFENGHLGDSRTLGGLLVHASNDVFEAHPAMIGQMNHFKLVGIYDTKIQKLANSRTVQVISSCLALALSEYEVGRSRADALTKLNSSTARTPQRPRGRFGGGILPDESEDFTHSGLDSDCDSEGPPSTESTMSITRLRFAVCSIFSLREAARYKYDHYEAYLSRSSLAYTGQQVVGEGLDGCARRTLDFIVSYDPDGVLLHDPRILFEGLQEGKWTKRRLNRVMNSTLAASTIAESSAFTHKSGFPLSKEEYRVLNAVSLNPDSKATDGNFNIFLKRVTGESDPSLTPEITSESLQLNYLSCFLFTATYFVAHPTSLVFARAVNVASAKSALINGAPNLSALVCTAIHCWYISHEIAVNRFPRKSVRSMKWFFAFAAFMGWCGNAIIFLAVERNSFFIAVLGRLTIGFSFTEILNRQLLCVCLPSLMVKESARLTKYKIAGLISGLLCGTMTQTMNLGVRGVQITSSLLSLLWFVHLIRICRGFKCLATYELREGQQPLTRVLKVESDNANAGMADTESVESPSVLQQSSDDSSQDGMNSLKAAYGSKESIRLDLNLGERSLLSETETHEAMLHHAFGYRLVLSVAKLKKLVMFHPGIPVALILVTFTIWGWEVLFSATPIVVSRYFQWSYVRGGAFLCWLGLLVLPTHLVSSHVAHRFEERTVLKRSICIVATGFFGLINWMSIYSLSGRVPLLFSDMDGKETAQYDWRIGILQYLIGASVAFVGLISLNGASLSLLSKVSPHRQKSAVINIGTVITLLSLFARILADGQILLVDLSNMLINTDLVNALAIPTTFVCVCLLFMVKRSFYYLL